MLGMRFSDSEVDSDQEICRLVAAQQTSHDVLQHSVEDSNLEVVGVDYLVTSRLRGDEDDYDSTDTDELLASSKNVTADCFSEMKTEPVKEKHEPLTSGKPFSSQEKPAGVLPEIKVSSSEADSNEEDEEEIESSDSSSDFDYEAMFSNVTHLEISLADLQKLSETTLPSTPCSSPEQEVEPRTRKGITPEEILASLLEEDSEEEKQKKKKKKGRASALLPAFQGTKRLKATSGRDADVRKHKLNSDSLHEKLQDSEMETSESRGGEEEGEETRSSSGSKEEQEEEVIRREPAPCSSLCESSTSKKEQEEAPTSVLLGAEEEEELQRKANIRRLAALHQRQKETEEQKRLIQGALSNLNAPAPSVGKHIVFGSEEEDEENQEAVSVLLKMTLSQDSQSEARAAVSQKATVTEVRRKPSGPQLFPQSDDDEDGDEEEDSSRFDLRPEFEGQAGQKLMVLQSRFGTDERFRMDSRFLEGDDGEEEEKEATRSPEEGEEEEDLEGEREKNLSILQSVLQNSQQTSRKTASKTTMFRDVSALHYDPSREEHATFETKTDGTKTESKVARRKRWEEAQKLPEVSNEIYFDVSGDLKAVFGQVKDEAADGDKTSWDQVKGQVKWEEDPLLSLLPLADPSNATEELTGFKFSFFGDEAETGNGETEYKAEKIQAPKVSWHQDPHFHDSSSEEEEEEQEEEQRSIAAKTTEEEAPPDPDLFFFYPDDRRLKEGPRVFCRSSQLEEQREQWEERRSELRQEYRKKHKDARRKLKTNQRTGDCGK